MNVELQAFDIDHPDIDHVAIYPLTGRDEEGNRYRTVAFVGEELPDGTVHYDEPDTWDVDEAFREAVLDRAFVDEHELRLKPLPLVDGEPV